MDIPGHNTYVGNSMYRVCLTAIRGAKGGSDKGTLRGRGRPITASLAVTWWEGREGKTRRWRPSEMNVLAGVQGYHVCTL